MNEVKSRHVRSSLCKNPEQEEFFRQWKKGKGGGWGLGDRSSGKSR